MFSSSNPPSSPGPGLSRHSLTRLASLRESHQKSWEHAETARHCIGLVLRGCGGPGFCLAWCCKTAALRWFPLPIHFPRGKRVYNYPGLSGYIVSVYAIQPPWALRFAGGVLPFPSSPLLPQSLPVTWNWGRGSQPAGRQASSATWPHASGTKRKTHTHTQIRATCLGQNQNLAWVSNNHANHQLGGYHAPISGSALRPDSLKYDVDHDRTSSAQGRSSSFGAPHACAFEQIIQFHVTFAHAPCHFRTPGGSERPAL